MAEALAYLKLEGVPFVTLYVGPEKTPFHVHESLLFDASTAFKDAFSRNFQEASQRSMALPEDDHGSVRRMVQWLYARKCELTDPVSVETFEECFMQLAKLNTLADKYDMHLLKNYIIDELFHLVKPPGSFRPPQVPVAVYVYNNTPRESSFRKLLVAWFVYGIDLTWYHSDTAKESLATAPHEFAIDLAMALAVRAEIPYRASPFTHPSSTWYEMPPKKRVSGSTTTSPTDNSSEADF